MEILLIRHGEPTGAINPTLSASGFAHWVRNYNLSKVTAKSLPPKGLGKRLESHFVVSSDLARCIDSANLCMNRSPDLILKQLREMEIPRYKLPFFLKAYTWLIISRLLWLVGINSKAESFKMAKSRAKLASELLQRLAIEHGKVAVFGHGLMNRYIEKELRKGDWLGASQNKKYWSVSKLNKPPYDNADL